MGFNIDNTNSTGPTGASFADNLFQVYDDADMSVSIRFSVNGTAGTNTTIVTAQTANRLITLPDTSDAVLVAAFAQTVSSKTLDNSNNYTARDDRFVLQDSGDTTKQAVFQLSSITTATTRTYTVPDITGLLSLNPMTTLGDMVYGAAGGVETRLAAGTSGQYLASAGAGAPVWTTFTPPTIQKFTSSSGTYNLPANVKYIRVKMVGGGGGGGGGGTGGQTAGNATSASTASTFGSHSAGGGLGGSAGNTGGGEPAGGAGGTSSIAAGGAGTALKGGGGGGGENIIVATYANGGIGGSSAFGGAAKGAATGTGQAGVANTGGGGGGGGTTTGPSQSGGGGGSGGFIDIIIASPASSYSYVVGVGGSGGNAGTSGNAGGAGGSGYIEVTEYYQ